MSDDDFDFETIKPHELERQLRRLVKRGVDVYDGGHHDGRPRDDGRMLEALIREHGPDGRPDIFTPSKK